MAKTRTIRSIVTPWGPVRMRKACVYDITYRCRPMGDDPEDREEGSVRAYWTGKVDAWGKYTLCPTDGQPTLYLFADEFVELDAI